MATGRGKAIGRFQKLATAIVRRARYRAHRVDGQKVLGRIEILDDDRPGPVGFVLRPDTVISTAAGDFRPARDDKAVIAAAAFGPVAVIHDETVIAILAQKRVGPVAAIQIVVTGPAADQVIATRTAQIIMALAAKHRVIAVASPDIIIAKPAAYRIRAVMAVNDVITGIAEQRVIARGATDQIAARTPADKIIAAVAGLGNAAFVPAVVARPQKHAVVARTARHNIIAATGIDRIGPAKGLDRVVALGPEDHVFHGRSGCYLIFRANIDTSIVITGVAGRVASEIDF